MERFIWVEKTMECEITFRTQVAETFVEALKKSVENDNLDKIESVKDFKNYFQCDIKQIEVDTWVDDGLRFKDVFLEILEEKAVERIVEETTGQAVTEILDSLEEMKNVILETKF